MPSQPSLSLLFHPKKNKKHDPQHPPPRKAASASASPRPRPAPANDDTDDFKLPDCPFQEFRLLSSALNGWKYDVMKFESRKPVDISKWTTPIKLNRKDLRKDDGSVNASPQAVQPMLGLDGKPVIGTDGRVVMVDAEGRPIHSNDSSAKDKGKGAANAKKRFQKKTKQVFFVAEELRQLRREERYPWVMEDSSPNKNEVWIGQMEEVSKAETHAFFMPAANDVFKFVPAHRWYKFQKKLKHELPTGTAEVESLYTKSQKRDPQTFMASRKGGMSAATAAMFRAESEGKTISVGSSLVYSAGQSLGPGNRKLKTVDSGMNRLFDDDDDDGNANRRREKEFGGEGDLDEQIYEEEFADDEEQMNIDENDEEGKEIEERLKRQYKSANRQGETGVDAEVEEEEEPVMSKQAKAMQKLIRNREGNDAYDSDEEKNPYASTEEEEEEEEEDELPVGPAIQPQPSSRSQTPVTPAVNSQTKPDMDARAVSPPSSVAHSLLAKRATSPKIPKPRPSGGGSRANSPLGSRASSPAGGSRPTSPIGLNHRAGSPDSVVPKLNNKRKAEEPPNGTSLPVKPKKKKAGVPGVSNSAVSAAELESMLINWLVNAPNPTTRDCIHHFTPYLKDSDKKQEFSALVKKVAQLKDGVLVLRQKLSAAPSPLSGTQ